MPLARAAIQGRPTVPSVEDTVSPRAVLDLTPPAWRCLTPKMPAAGCEGSPLLAGASLRPSGCAPGLPELQLSAPTVALAEMGLWALSIAVQWVHAPRAASAGLVAVGGVLFLAGWRTWLYRWPLYPAGLALLAGGLVAQLAPEGGSHRVGLSAGLTCLAVLSLPLILVVPVVQLIYLCKYITKKFKQSHSIIFYDIILN